MPNSDQINELVVEDIADISPSISDDPLKSGIIRLCWYLGLSKTWDSINTPESGLLLDGNKSLTISNIDLLK